MERALSPFESLGCTVSFCFFDFLLFACSERLLGIVTYATMRIEFSWGGVEVESH
jgi:hypothetical protein